MIGFYSNKAVKEGKPVAIYLDQTGKEVEVTAVYESQECMKRLYLYDDTISVGELYRFIGRK